MKNLFLPLFLVVVFVATVAFAMSTSKSCTWVNGVMTCESSEDKEGNFAGAASMASTGFGNGPSTYNSASTGSSKTGFVDVQSSRSGDSNFQAGNPAQGFSFGSSVATSGGYPGGGQVSTGVVVGGGGAGVVGVPGTGVSVGPGGVAVSTPGGGVYVGGGFPFAGGFPFVFTGKKK